MVIRNCIYVINYVKKVIEYEWTSERWRDISVGSEMAHVLIVSSSSCSPVSYLEHSNAQTAFRWSKPLIVIVNWRQSPFPYHLQDTLMYFISLPSPDTLPPCTHRPTIINKRYLSRPSRNLLLLRPDLSLPRRIVHQPWSTPIQVSRAIVASPATLCEINYAFVI